MSSTLAITITAKDDASATLKKVATNGQQVGTSLSSAGKKGTSAISGVNASTARFQTTLKKVAGYVGIAYGVAKVVEFGKASIAAYEGLERQQQLVEGGLKRINAANQFPQLERDLKGVSDRTVTLQASTQQVAAAVLNAGHAYFQSLGPNASKVLSGLTNGILNISAATHKSLSMLQRSLTLAVINTPDKAIGTLQKLGIASADQVARWKDMAKAGDLVTLQQEEINAITKAYPGAATEAATASDRWAKTLDDLKIRLGRVLAPIVTVGDKALQFVSQNMKLITVVGGFVATLFVARGALLAFAASSANATGALGFLSAEAATAGVAIDSMLGPIGLVAGAAILLIGNLDGIRRAAYRLDASPLGGGVQGILDDLKQRLASGAISLEIYDKALGRLASNGKIDPFMQSFLSGVAHMDASTKTSTDHVVADVSHMVRSTTRFAGKGEHAFKKWAKSIRHDAHSSITSLGGVELATHKTARAFLHDSDRMARAAAQDAKAMRRLAGRSQDWVPDGYKQWLVAQGPAAVANFEQLTHDKQQSAVTDWKKAAGGAKQYQSALDRLSPASIDRARTAADQLNRSVEQLAMKSPMYVDIYIRQHGKIPGHAAGGYIASPELALVGERGPELVGLPGGSTVYPHGRGPAMPAASAATGSATGGALRFVSGEVTINEKGKLFIRGLAREVVSEERRYRGWN